MSTQFLKMNGAGNDFMVFDDRDAELAGVEAGRWTLLCARRTGIGADGVLLMRGSEKSDFRMIYLNADGREAAMCGNGARCVAWAAAVEFGLGHPYTAETPSPAGWHLPEGFGARQVWSVAFEAEDGMHLALGWDRTVLIALGEPAPPARMELETPSGSFAGHLLTIGVPHFVVTVPDPAEVPLSEVGPALRAHPDLGPNGANVDFLSAEPDAEGCYSLRTWERGVEGETLACGTGTASAAALAASRGQTSPIAIRGSGGDVMRVHFSGSGESIADLWLEGPVLLAYRGSLADI